MPVLRFPTKIISYAERLYFAFALSYKDVQMLLYRGIDRSYETIRDRS